MKKLAVLLMGFVMLFSFTACSSRSSSSSDTSDTSSSVNSSSQSSQSSSQSDSSSSESSQSDSSQAESDTETGGTLVVYFSATGNTEEAANYIAELTGGDLFELEPADPYTDADLNYGDQDSRVVYEHDNPDARDVELVADTVENWDKYDTVFIGYPNWWADLPMAVYSFFDEYDFSGKTLVPFNVHNGSRFSRTIQTIEELEPNANVIEEGFTVSEQSVADAAGDVAAWLEELGF